MGLESWSKEWNEIYDYIAPSDKIIKRFIQDIENNTIFVTKDDLMKGKYNNITPYILTYYYIDNNTKYDLSQFEMILADTIIDIEINEETAEQLFIASILLADSDNDGISVKSKSNVEIIHKNNWCSYSNIKDVLRYLNHKNLHPVWFRRWLENGNHIPSRNL